MFWGVCVVKWWVYIWYIYVYLVVCCLSLSSVLVCVFVCWCRSTKVWSLGCGLVCKKVVVVGCVFVLLVGWLFWGILFGFVSPLWDLFGVSLCLCVCCLFETRWRGLSCPSFHQLPRFSLDLGLLFRPC